ncbi:TPA: tetratricopeptide repeat protein [Candidatus Bipolaricaulota bacterium]|nr:tetratricopeptide repeat protein [Candidatus Bipolaricaulota bacterium]
MRDWWWVGAIVLLVLMLIIGVRPYGLAVYHLEMGARALDEALVPVFPDRLAPEQVVDAGRLAAGMEHLVAALRWDPRNVQALRMLARGYVSLGETEAALVVLRRALALQPRNPVLHLELGDVYDSLGDVEAAVREYEAGRIGSRSLPAAANYLKLAEAQIQVGSGEQAIALWRKALEMDPGNLYALYRLAKIHQDLGDEEHAAEYRRRLRQLGPEKVAVPLDFRLAEYQGRAMVGLVEDGIWDREILLDAVAYHVEQFGDGVLGLMVERELEVILEAWPGDEGVLFYLTDLHHRRGEQGQDVNGFRDAGWGKRPARCLDVVEG